MVYNLSVDLIGPFCQGWDYGRKQEAKYGMVAMITVPRGDDVDPEKSKDEKSGGVSEEDVPLPNVEDGVRLLEEEASVEENDVLQDLPEPEGGDDLDCLDVDGEEAITEEECGQKEVIPEKDRVQKEKEDMEAATRPIRAQNIVFFEPLASRHASDILKGLDVVWNQCRALGIPAYRFHTDRAKEFLSHQVQRWVSQHGMTQTMTAGDDGPSNGRIEAEVNQFKRRLRLIMGASMANKEEWPSVARHAAQEGQRAQLQKLGLPQRPMIPYNQKVMVKTKVWHKRYSEGMSNPYLQGTLKGPSPMMNGGWVIQDKDGKIQHARMALVPDPNADKAMLELVRDVDKPDRRVVGKQPLYILCPRSLCLVFYLMVLYQKDEMTWNRGRKKEMRTMLDYKEANEARTSRLHCTVQHIPEWPRLTSLTKRGRQRRITARWAAGVCENLLDFMKNHNDEKETGLWTTSTQQRPEGPKLTSLKEAKSGRRRKLTVSGVLVSPKMQMLWTSSRVS